MEKTQLDVAKIRSDFPMLFEQVKGRPLVYLDNAATTHKPKAVLDTMNQFLGKEYATIHRGVYYHSQQATNAFDEAREKVARFLNAPSSNEIIFTKGTTEAINLVAASFARPFIQPGDEIVISAIEHHANIVPWQQVLQEKGGTLRVIPVDDNGDLIIEEYEKLLNDKTYLVALTYVSNALGTINPVKQMIEMAHAKGIPVLLDGAQSTPHTKVDVQDLDCDFYAFSGHKIYAPTGIGALYAKMKHLEKMPPYQTGGDMIETVTFEKTTFAKPPAKFEAGTPAIAEVIALGAALDYLESIGLDAIDAYEHQLLQIGTEKLLKIDGLRIVGTAKKKAAVISFVFDDVHPHDVGTLLDNEGIAVRAGHHCAQPVMDRFAVPATTRASFSFYNTPDEIDALVEGLEKVLKLFR